ncbi:hypothetical protein ACLOJK_027065 [Asimina triloba]
MVVGRRHRDGTRPVTGSHNPQAVRFSYINSYRKFGSTSLRDSSASLYLRAKSSTAEMILLACPPVAPTEILIECRMGSARSVDGGLLSGIDGCGFRLLIV